jgi:SAM-dependent methyltransferase
MHYYDDKYFEWQREIGRITTKFTKHYFEPYIKPTDKVVDFGCGGGTLLAALNCAGKTGVEINPHAREHAKSLGVNVLESPQGLPDNAADVIISSHCLEHCHDPLSELRSLYTKLVPGGRIIFVTPYERYTPYVANDVNQHIFTWSPMCMGNLFTLAGFQIEDVSIIKHRFPPGYMRLQKILPASLFHFACVIWGHWYTDMQQVRCVGRKG